MSEKHWSFVDVAFSFKTTPYGKLTNPFRTHKALIDSDITTGRKLINQYEVIEEIGRGMHGKVKLARNLETGENVAIKIIPRFSKTRRLGKVTAKSPQDKTKKEIAILKKIRHANVVALIEVIDDPELKKIYMVLEHVELGEIVWRKKGLPHIASYERRRVERGLTGEVASTEEDKYDQLLERRQALKEAKRAKMALNYGISDYWSNEHGAGEDSGSSYGQRSRISSKEDFAIADTPSRHSSRPSSQVPSRSHSIASITEDAPFTLDEGVDWEEDLETPGPLQKSCNNSGTALDRASYSSHIEEGFLRGRSPSMADSIISHMSSIDFNHHAHDAFADDFSYVPCFTVEQARIAFRDTVLGLEYLHYQGVVHRDIKPANLLRSRDHRVKISDFGVSYFGRPIREGEADDELVSESEAKDFDDDLELAKTVGTPAFFAPELCYTDPDQEQPKVSEQIDVWSLGVTLYCLIFARIPFLAEDEFQMFRKIATEEVLIPKKRLKPVDPSTSPAQATLFKRQTAYQFRDDADLEYEEIDSSLHDLLRSMLCKNPDRRIRLRDIKRHPWVVQGIANPIGWLDDTDPARPSSGRRIQVNENEMSSAVVPLTFLERARSVVKKAVGKVMHPLVERSESSSRRRANSSATSSAGDSMANNFPATPQCRTERRKSVRIDDYFANALSSDAHPTHTSSLGQNSETMQYDPMATLLPSMIHSKSDGTSNSPTKHESQLPAPIRHLHRRGKLSQQFLSLTGPALVPETKPTPATPFYDNQSGGAKDSQSELRQSRREGTNEEDNARSRSVDASILNSLNMRAEPRVALNTEVAPGYFQSFRQPRPVRSVDLGRSRAGLDTWLPISSSPQTMTPATYGGYHPFDFSHSPRRAAFVPERPQTVSRANNIANEMSLPSLRHAGHNSTLVSARTRELLLQRRQSSSASSPHARFETAQVSCPVSPEHAAFSGRRNVISTEATRVNSKSSSMESIDATGTPLTSPSELVSAFPSAAVSKTTAGQMLAFQSDPSLPALLSGASSVSADIEGELLGRPGVVSTRPDLLETTDSLTPPAMAKESTNGFPFGEVFGNNQAMESGQLDMRLSGGSSRPSTRGGLDGRKTNYRDGAGYDSTGDDADDDAADNEYDDDDDDDGSDDDFLQMAKSKKAKTPTATGRPARYEARRRDTNMSTASDETAKKVPMYVDDNGKEPQ